MTKHKAQSAEREINEISPGLASMKPPAYAGIRGDPSDSARHNDIS